MTLTSDTITDDQIRWLRYGAEWAGNADLADVCSTALGRQSDPIVAACRAKCAAVINAMAVGPCEVQP